MGRNGWLLLALTPLALLALLSPRALAEPPAPFEDRVRILTVEVNRGPAEDLAPFLAPEANPLSRQLAIQALGRIGDRGKAPDMLASLLERGGEDLRLVLYAAGLAQTERLAGAIAKHLGSEDAAILAAAAQALGWTGKADEALRLSPLLEHPHAGVRAAALEGIARLGAEGCLERVLRSFFDTDEGVRASGEFATWLLSGKRRAAATKVDPAWDGDEDLAHRFGVTLSSDTSARKLAALRPFGILMTKRIPETHRFPHGFLPRVFSDPDARVAQELVARVLSKREGEAVDETLTLALAHPDAKVRALAAEALGQRKSAASAAQLRARLAAETDPRVRETLVVECARCGDEEPARQLAIRSDRPEDPVVRDLTRLQVLLASSRLEALDELFDWLDPAAPESAKIHAAVWMEACSGLEDRDDPRTLDWLGWMLANQGRMDPYVLAAADQLAGARKACLHLLPLLEQVDVALGHETIPDVAQALADALGALARAETAPEGARAKVVTALARLAGHPSLFARRGVRAVQRDLAVEGVPDDVTDRANDWRGLPRPTEPVLGLDLPGEGPWLTVAEILRIADRIDADRPRIAFQTTAGAFAIELEPALAPVHCVSLLLAAQAGVYDGTRWHRVVPSFVIQGGDPHGHGAGGGGWTVPDEITPLPFVRGALGMPKSVKDDGGCQLFVMHTDYRPLDGRYTCYGRVVSGMETVDGIRVGDRILGARILLEGGGR
jgi:cyclophilin family peptidyl-prolyl cis-trans isomerase/HEAT repeat protein